MLSVSAGTAGNDDTLTLSYYSDIILITVLLDEEKDLQQKQPRYDLFNSPLFVTSNKALVCKFSESCVNSACFRTQWSSLRRREMKIYLIVDCSAFTMHHHLALHEL